LGGAAAGAGVDPGLTRCGLSVVESRSRPSDHQILGLQAKPTPADALALAICHCWRAPMIARMAEAEAKVAEQRKKFAAKVRAAT
jgi:Holliday junction resolvasome RuvABC endonuclease subunit